MSGGIVWLVALAVPVQAAPAVPAANADAFAGVPGVVVRPYPVQGSDVETLRRSIDAARPADPHDGQRVDALTHWSMTWRWPGRRHGGCDLARATVAFRATVTLPALADDAALPPAVAQDWDRYRLALQRHEAGHVRYAYDHRHAVLAAIRAATCATADRAGRRALSAIAAHDLAYDARTQHGMTEGAAFPAGCTGDAMKTQQSGCTSLPATGGETP